MADPQYRYRTVWSEEDGEWVGLCDGFPLVSWLDPDREAAEAGIRAVVADVVDDLRAQGRPLPPPGVQWPPTQAAARREAPAARS